MESRKFVYRETALVAIGQAICVAVMIGIFALLGHFDMTVLWGGIAGMLGLAGYMEYFVQNNGHRALLAYSVMGGSLLIAVACTLTIRWLDTKTTTTK
jgi:hypothetical protein